MHFDERNLHTRERVTNRETGVDVRSCVHQSTLGSAAQAVHCLDYLAFAIVLHEREIDAQFFGDRHEVRLNVGQRLGPIEFGLTRAEQVEVWPIDDGDSHSPVSPSSQARNFATSSSDSGACGSRGFTRGVGIGGVGGVVRAPGVPLNAPASREAALLSAGFTCAPANTASSEAPGAAPPSATALSVAPLAF